MINVVILGCGAITDWRHGPECRDSDKVNLVGFWNRTYETAKKFAEKFGGRAYESYDEVLADKGVDAIIVTTNNATHMDMTVRALESGKHVLCEKPLAVTAEEAEKMIEASRKTGKLLLTAFNQRLDPAHVALKKVIDDKTLGRVLSFETSFVTAGPEGWSANKTPSTWFFNKDSAGMGAVGDLGVHKADLMSYLLGERFRSVYAAVRTLDKKGPDGEPIQIEDNGYAILESESGITGSLHASWVCYGRGGSQTVIHFENGTAVTDGAKLTLYHRDGKFTEVEITDKARVLCDVLAESVEKGVPEISGEDGLWALKTAVAAIKSSATSSKIDI